MPDQQLNKTVLELDLASYSDVARVLEENLDVTAVKAFEDQIQSFVDRGLESVNLKRADVVLGTAGDNAILIFDHPEPMHEFARAVQELTLTHNQSKTVAAAKRWFRMGAATGTVLVLESEKRIVGSTVARAVRLEAAAAKGQLIIDLATYNKLPKRLKKCYGTEEVVQGKRDESFRVRKCTMIEVEESGSGKPITHETAKPLPASAVVDKDKLATTKSDFTQGDWITAAIVGPERVETFLKRLAGGLNSLRSKPREEAAKYIEEKINAEIDNMLQRFERRGQTDEDRLEACLAKSVADLLERELGNFMWQVEEQSGEHPCDVFRKTVKAFMAWEEQRFKKTE